MNFFHIPFRICLAIGALAFFVFAGTHAALALDTASVWSPAPNGRALDQPLKIIGDAPKNSTVYFWVDGKLAGGVKVNKPKTKTAARATFTFTYSKRIVPGTHKIEFQAQIGKTKSILKVQTFTVPSTWPRKTDGKIVSIYNWNRPPYAVMIENTPAARPQSGLSQASIVYETLAEGGVTRFMAIFDQSVSLKNVGPIRSSRPYYVDWARENEALYVHAGGSPDAYNEIKKTLVRSYDGLSKTGAKYMFRLCYGVHCLYSNSSKLSAMVRDAKLTNVSTTAGAWSFKDGATFANRPNTAKKITIDFNGKTYKAEWKYDRKSNTYKRFTAGVAAKDKNNGQQLAATNVLVLRIPKEKVLDKKGRLALNLIGTGKGTLYRDGQAIQIVWKKKSKIDKTQLYDASGKNLIQLNRGMTWVEVVPGSRSVTYK